MITGMLAGFDPETIAPGAAAEPTGELRNGARRSLYTWRDALEASRSCRSEASTF